MIRREWGGTTHDVQRIEKLSMDRPFLLWTEIDYERTHSHSNYMLHLSSLGLSAVGRWRRGHDVRVV
jgi:hypothetical protein